jgi:hypothetical protein
MATEIERVVLELQARNYIVAAAEVQRQNALLARSFAQVETASAKVSGGRVETTLKGVDNQGRRLTKTMSQAARGLGRVGEQFSVVQSSAIATQGAISGVISRLVDLGKLVGVSLVIGGAFRLQQAFEDALGAASELSIKLAEIDTIQASSALTTQRWAEELRRLSNAFGIDTIKQAEAAYQTLSNQVAEGAEAVRFLATANQLAVTGVTDTAASVGLLTAAVNAFGLDVRDAGDIAASFFKTVELGRVRIEDIANIFGRVAVPAGQLGISLNDLNAALAVTTIKGVEPAEAFTLIRNVILKLIRPTDEMQKLFTKLGVETGPAAIATFGFAGFLGKLEEATQGSASELGKLFGRIRAISGAAIFSGEGVGKFEAALAKIEATNAAALLEDFEKVIQSTGKQLDIAREQAANFFEEGFGTPAQEGVVALIKALGGMEQILTTTVRAARVLGQTLLLAFAFRQIIINVAGLTTAVEALTDAQRAAAATATNLRRATIAAFAGAGALILISEAIKSSADDALKAAEDANLAILRSNEEFTARARAQLREQTADLDKELIKRSRNLLQQLAARRSAISVAQAENVKESKETTRQFDLATKAFTKGVSTQIAANKKLLTSATKDAKTAATEIQKTFDLFSKADLTFNLTTGGIGQQVSVLTAELADVQKRAQDATEAGNLKAFQTATKRINTLATLRLEAQVKLQSASLRLDVELAEERSRLLRATTQDQREASRRRIDQLTREQRLLNSGTQSQIDSEEKIQDIRNRLATASGAEEIGALTRELTAARREQELIEASADRERKTRIAGLRLAAEQAERLKQIQIINEDRAKAAAQQERRLKIQTFLFQSISKEAAAFNLTTLEKVKNEEKFKDAVAEQQERFAQLITLQKALGGGATQLGLTQRRATQLQEAAELELQKRREDAAAATAAEALAAAQTNKQIAIEQATATNANLKRFGAGFSELSEAFKRTIEAIGSSQNLSRSIGRLTSTQVSGQGITSRGTTLARDFAALESNTARLAELSKVLQEQEDPAAEQEFNQLFTRTNTALTNLQSTLTVALRGDSARRLRLQSPGGLGDLSALSRAIGEGFRSIGGSEVSAAGVRSLPEIAAAQAQFKQIRTIEDEIETIEEVIAQKEKEKAGIVSVTSRLKIFKKGVERAAGAIAILQDATKARGRPQDSRLNPQDPPALERLTEDSKAAFSKDIKDATVTGVNEALTESTSERVKVAKAIAKEQAKEDAKLAADGARKLAQTKADEEARATKAKAADVAKFRAAEQAKADVRTRGTERTTLPRRVRRTSADRALERALAEDARSAATQARRRALGTVGRAGTSPKGTLAGTGVGFRTPFADTAQGAALQKALEKIAEREQALLDFLKEERAGDKAANEALEKAIPKEGVAEGPDKARGDAARRAGEAKPPSPGQAGAEKALERERKRQADAARQQVDKEKEVADTQEEAAKRVAAARKAQAEAAEKLAAEEAFVASLRRDAEAELQGALKERAAALEVQANTRSILQAQIQGGIDTTDARAAFQRAQDAVRAAEARVAAAQATDPNLEAQAGFLETARAKELETRKSLNDALAAEEKVAKDLARAKRFEIEQRAKGLSPAGADAVRRGTIEVKPPRERPSVGRAGEEERQRRAERQRFFDERIGGFRPSEDAGPSQAPSITTESVERAQREAARVEGQRAKSQAQLDFERKERNAAILEQGKEQTKVSASLTESVDKLDSSVKSLTEATRKLPRTRLVTGGVEVGAGFAEGGSVGGPGGIDNVPAMLTRGEFVVNSKDAKRFLPQLRAINAGQIPKFRNGGPVGFPRDPLAARPSGRDTDGPEAIKAIKELAEATEANTKAVEEAQKAVGRDLGSRGAGEFPSTSAMLEKLFLPERKAEPIPTPLDDAPIGRRSGQQKAIEDVEQTLARLFDEANKALRDSQSELSRQAIERLPAPEAPSLDRAQNAEILERRRQAIEAEKEKIRAESAVPLGRSRRPSPDPRSIGRPQAPQERAAAERTRGEESARAAGEGLRPLFDSIESVVDDLAGSARFIAPRAPERDVTEAAETTSPLDVIESASRLEKEIDNLTIQFKDLDTQLGKFSVRAQFKEPSPAENPFREFLKLGFQEGGPVTGRGGVDNIPAMLTRGEFVVRASQAQKFMPQLLAMNSGRFRPQGFAEGGPVDVGGIQVTVNESSSPQATARQIAAEINRGIRTRTIRMRRS